MRGKEGEKEMKEEKWAKRRLEKPYLDQTRRNCICEGDKCRTAAQREGAFRVRASREGSSTR
jgi:hypothetical protein